MHELTQALASPGRKIRRGVYCTRSDGTNPRRLRTTSVVSKSSRTLLGRASGR